MKKMITVFLLCFVTHIFSQSIILENETTRLKIDILGGKIRQFLLKNNPVNPIHSNYAHFICFDRWGPSSATDQAKGIPTHGEAQTVTWKVNQSPIETGSHIYSEMSCTLPKVKMSLKRKIWLDKNVSVVKIFEEVTNQNSTAKIFNLVQHPTIGAPFLDSTTIVDTKVIKGFSQAGTIPPAEAETIGWPNAELEGYQLDLRRLTGKGPEHLVLSYTLDANQEYGWVTAINASKGLMIGYIWPIEESPWLNLWLSQYGHVPGARGLEFGTTGLHQPFDIIETVDSIFTKQLCEYLEPNESVTKSYIAFLAAIPSDYKGVQEITYLNDNIKIVEYGAEPARDINIITSSIPTDINDGLSLEIPDKFQLMQNYPNPFNPSTTIQYSIPASLNPSKGGTYVDLNVYDVLGRKVVALVNEEKQPSNYEVKFNGVGMPSGVYFYQLRVGSYTDTKKMILMK